MAESAVLFLLKKLAPLLQEQVTLLSGVREEAEYIRDELERMTVFLRVADSMEENDPEVQVWVKQVRNVAYDTVDVLDLFQFRLAPRQFGNRFSGYFLDFLHSVKNLGARHQIASKIQSIKARVINISDGHQRYRLKLNMSEQQQQGSTVLNNTWYDPRGDALFLEEADLVGIDKSKKKLIPWLVEGDSGLKVVSVVGLGGLGKTTLVKKVYDDAMVEPHFQNHAWISVSESFKVELLLKDMIQQFFEEIHQPVPQGVESMNINELKRIIKQFLQRKRYLVVFDDVWEINVWESIKHALPIDNCGSRVMLTTRNVDVASTCCVETDGNVFHLQPLSEKESWSLFCNKAFRRNPCPQHLEEVCKNILNKCEGLPLAIVTIGGVLAKKERSRASEWELFYQTLGSELMGSNKLERVRRLLSLSYYDLPYYLKICFLYLSIFPEVHEIECTRLVRLWTAEGFVQMKEGMAVEEVAEGYLNELVDRSLIQVVMTKLDGRIGRCRVHDLLREIIISKSIEQNIIAIYCGGDISWPEKVQRLSIHNRLGTTLQGQSSKHFSQLRSLLMFGVKDPLSKSSMCWRTRTTVLPNGGLRLLKVLDLRGADLETFPDEIVRLYHLRYLSLRDTKVKVLPRSIGKLENLETLDLKRTLVTRLPDGIQKLQKIRHLLGRFRAPMKISGLTSLQNLFYINASVCSDVVREVGMLTQLRRLGISCLKREDGVVICASLQKLSNLRSLLVWAIYEDEIIDLQHPLSSLPRFLQKLDLRGRLEKLPHWIPSLHGLVKVVLQWSKLSDDPLQSLEDLPNLLDLKLDKAYDGEGLCFKAGRFQSLKRLVLRSLAGLRWVRVEEGAMPHLEYLRIDKCELLEELPSGIEHLTDLKRLVFNDMPDKLIMSIDPDRGVDYWKVVLIQTVWVGSVSADGETIWRSLHSGLGTKIFRREEGMVICSSLEKLSSLRSFSATSDSDDSIDLQHPLSSVPRFLQTLQLRGCLEKLPHWISSLHVLVRVELYESKLRDDPLQSLEDLPNLLVLVLYKAYEGEGLCFKARRFQRLKRLTLDSLEGLKWVRLEEGAMPHLEYLRIEKCELLEEVPSGIDHLTDLRKLVFYDMPDKLVMSIEPDTGVDYWKVVLIHRVFVGLDSDDGEAIWRSLHR